MPEAPKSWPVGTTFTVTGTSYTNTGAKTYSYDVTLSKVDQQAAPANEFSGASAGKHLIGLKFKVTGTQGVTDDNAFNNTSIQGSDDQIYNATFASQLVAGTTFNNGQINLSVGEHDSRSGAGRGAERGAGYGDLIGKSGFGGEKATRTVG